MAYLHGIRVEEQATQVSSPVTTTTGVTVAFGTAPVNLAEDPDNATNTLFFCETFAEAKAALGYSEDYESYPLCQVMDSFFKAHAVGPVVFCNVLDPTEHIKSYSESIDVISGQATGTTAGVILSTITVSGMTLDTDYTVEFNDDGYPVFTLADSSTAGPLTVTGSALDPTAVTYSDVIGAYDSDTGVETGIELVRQVYPKFSRFPGLLIAPGFSQIPAVAAALAAKCTDINGRFRCECLIDIDTEAYTKYTDVEAAKDELGVTSEHAILLWPMVQYSDKIMAYSSMLAAFMTKQDYENDNVPGLYPSNKKLGISAAVLSDGTEVYLDETQANELNAIGVVTIINWEGLKCWGNNTAAYPDNTDPKDRWIGCRRFFSWHANSFIVNYNKKVDDPTNYRLIQSLVDSENIRGNALVSEGKCAGMVLEYRKEDNPIENIIDGTVVFRQRIAPWTPAEYILNMLEFDVDMIETALGGGDEE